MRDILKINSAKAKSLSLPFSWVTLSDEKDHAFFKFEKGRLVEFDLSKYAGKPVRLTAEEAAICNEWSDDKLRKM